MSIAHVVSLIENPISYPQGKRYAAILGASPSKGARSPALWNAAFSAHGVDAKMLAMDIAADRLAMLLQALEADSSFIGGAIAVPHKEAVAQWLGDRITPEAKAIGAVNCLFRDANGRLKGTNTDGEAALQSFEATLGPVGGKKVLLLGPGGAGRAVAAYFQKAVGNNAGRLIVAGRSEAAEQFARRIGATWLEWQQRLSVLPNIDVLINCTSLGSGSHQGESPLAAEELALMPSQAVVFDIVYQPSPTALLALAAGRGLPILDGTIMNLGQAILAYGHAAPEPNGRDATRHAMEAAKKTLN